MRWPDGRSGRTDHDGRPVPRCGNGRWHRAPCDVAMQDATAAVPRNCCPLNGRYRPPPRWAGSSLHQPPGTLHLVRAGHLDGFQRTGNRLQMALGQVQVNGGVSELGVSEKHLDGAQIGAGFQPMGSEAMSKRMRRYVLGDPGTLGSLVHGLPDDLLCNGHVGPPALYCAWEKIGLGLHPSPVDRKSTRLNSSHANISYAVF